MYDPNGLYAPEEGRRYNWLNLAIFIATKLYLWNSFELLSWSDFEMAAISDPLDPDAIWYLRTSIRADLNVYFYPSHPRLDNHKCLMARVHHPLTSHSKNIKTSWYKDQGLLGDHFSSSALFTSFQLGRVIATYSGNKGLLRKRFLSPVHILVGVFFFFNFLMFANAGQ